MAHTGEVTPSHSGRIPLLALVLGAAVAVDVPFALFTGAALTSAVWCSAQYGFPTGHELWP